MARRTSLRRNTIRRPRRKLIWVRYFDGAILDPEGVNSDQALIRYPLGQFEVDYGAQLLGATVMAVRGPVTATLVEPADEQTTEAFACARFAMRVIDVSDQDNNYDFDAIYTDQAHADWFLWEPFLLHNGGILGAGDPNNLETPEATTGSETRMLNNRSKRKIEELDQTIELHIGVPSNGSNHNNCFIHFFWDLSFLIALP